MLYCSVMFYSAVQVLSFVHSFNFISRLTFFRYMRFDHHHHHHQHHTGCDGWHFDLWSGTKLGSQLFDCLSGHSRLLFLFLLLCLVFDITIIISSLVHLHLCAFVSVSICGRLSSEEKQIDFWLSTWFSLLACAFLCVCCVTVIVSSQ